MKPIELAGEIDKRYRDYLATTFYFRDPELRSLFREALDAGSLSNGTFIEGRPVFKRTVSPKEVLTGLLGRPPDERLLDALLKDRLYLHQEEAIRRAFAGENVVIATGTSSGKTEAFLYPILLSLYQEFLEGRVPGTDPGVRALILYPMNALANDQKERLGRICKVLKNSGCPFSFTFGEYTGATPEHEKDRPRIGKEPRKKLDGEIMYRHDMRETPPDILLTNYSMLEYLLIRPKDSRLFDSGRARHWRFIVIDEAHQYMGIRGTELGMLIRRLKQRLIEGGREEPFTCIATSATIVGKDRDTVPVAEFAEVLLGEEFEPSNVMLGETVKLSGNSQYRLATQDYSAIAQAMETGCREGLVGIAAQRSVCSSPTDSAEQILGRLLLADARSRELLDNVSGAIRVQDLARQLFPDLPLDEALQSTITMVDLLARAKTETGEPLMTARYHHFLKGLEGAFISYRPKTSLSLNRGSSNGDQARFEIALCSECGQHYLTGRIAGGYLVEAVRDPASDEFGVTYFLPLDEDTSDAESPLHPSIATHRLCPVCSRIYHIRTVPGCGHDGFVLLKMLESEADFPDELKECPVCGKKGRDPVKEVIHGADGPHAVVATVLHQNLEKPKVLAFADGRQEAAFFAWYVEETYHEMRSRSYLLEVIRRYGGNHEGLSTRDISEHLSRLYRDRKALSPTATYAERMRESQKAVLCEVVTGQPRLSLEGLGLIRWRIERPAWIEPPAVFMKPPWGLSADEAWHLLSLLLDSARADGAVALPQVQGSEVQWDEVFEIPQKHYTLGLGRGGRHRNWAGPNTRRTRFLALLLAERMGVGAERAKTEAVRALELVYQDIIESEKGVLQEDRLLPSGANGVVANLAWWRFQPVGVDEEVFRCEVCGRVSSVNTFSVCLRPGCAGRTVAVRLADLPPDHYRELYVKEFPAAFRAEEHTAQLARLKSTEYQEEFKAGNIHLLSSSTTFELGVDLGDLDTVFLRNVPPQPFNYAQRVGRAGRTGLRPGFAVTYCRRSPHDIYHFGRPERMMESVLERPPVTALTNVKVIQRHVTAYCLQRFFKCNEERFKDVKSLVVDFRQPMLLKDVQGFLQPQAAQIQHLVRCFVPDETWNELRLLDHGPEWLEDVCGKNSQLAAAEMAVCSEWVQLARFRDVSKEKNDFAAAAWAAERMTTIEKEDTLSYLSKACVIPKYGFPVDVVSLELYSAERGHWAGPYGRPPRTTLAANAYGVELQRDLSYAVAEYAPESRVIANKREWKSHGLKKVVGLQWPRRYYKYSARENVFEAWKEAALPPEVNTSNLDQYVVPVFGFVTDRKPPTRPGRRPARMYTTRPFFLQTDTANPEHEYMPSPGNRVVQVQKACPGTMVELCEGRRKNRFWVCDACGAAFKGESSYRCSHETPWGETCSEPLEPRALAHEFRTDIVEVRFLFRPSFTSSLSSDGRNDSGEVVWFSHSLAYALLNGVSRLLNVPAEDVNVAVRGIREPLAVQPIIIYDNVPGGAGLVAKLEDKQFFRAVLEAALDQVSGRCGCGPEVSCYGCLRSYRNQFAHEKLKRGPAKNYLERVLDDWPTE